MPQQLVPYLSEIVGLSVSLLLVAGYHVYLHVRLRRNPNYTIQAVNKVARAAWVENIMANHSKDVMAVQTLRNSTMAATFMASTAILLIIGVLNLSQQGEKLGTVLETLNHQPLTGSRLWMMKLLPLVADFFGAFFCFSLAVRMYNHVGYLINATAGGRFAATPAYVATLLNRGGRYYSLGMRSYYMSVPLVFWLFGPYYMLLASIGLITVLYHVDRSPKIDCVSEEQAPAVAGRADAPVSRRTRGRAMCTVEAIRKSSGEASFAPYSCTRAFGTIRDEEK